MPILTLPQIGRTIAVRPDQTVLDAALDAGVPFPHSCRSGRCGACKSQLLEGRVNMGAHTRFALSDEEKSRNQILACKAIPQTDVTVAWLEGEDAIPANQVVKQSAVVVDVESLTHDIRRIRLVLQDPGRFRFQPGQYIRLTVQDVSPRDYSLASLPEDDFLELHVRAVPGGRTSSRIVGSLSPDEVVQVEGPFGSAFLGEAHKGPIVAVAGGSGLAPIKSIVESALSLDPEREVHVYFGGRTPRDVYLVDRFRVIAKDGSRRSYNAILSETAPPGWRSGYGSDAIAHDHKSLAGTKIYAAGPPPMVEAVRLTALALGARPEDIHADLFITPVSESRELAEVVS